MYYNDNKSNTFVSFLSLDFSARTVQQLDTLSTEFMHVASGFILVSGIKRWLYYIKNKVNYVIKSIPTCVTMQECQVNVPILYVDSLGMQHEANDSTLYIVYYSTQLP